MSLDRNSLDTGSPPGGVAHLPHRDSGVFTGINRLFPGSESSLPAISNYNEKDSIRLSFANAIYLAGEVHTEKEKSHSGSPKIESRTSERSTVTSYLMKYLMNKFREQARRKVEKVAAALVSHSFSCFHRLLSTVSLLYFYL